jgi:nitrogen fixation NifU-like protein
VGALEQLYQQVILDHARERHGHGLRESAARLRMAQSHMVNPLCGDEVTLRVAVDRTADRDVVCDVCWVGEGCSISQAATSMLHDLVVDQTPERADELVGQFRAMVRSRGTAEPDEEALGDATAFVGVGRHANRVKCAMLGWSAFEDALHRAIAAPAVDAIAAPAVDAIAAPAVDPDPAAGADHAPAAGAGHEADSDNEETR